MAPVASTSSVQLKSLAQTTDADEQFIHFRASMRLPMAPRWSSNKFGDGGLDGVKEVLSGWILRYLPPLRAVLLTFDPASCAFPYPSSQFPIAASPFEAPLPPSSDLLKSPAPEGEEEVKDLPVVQLQAIPLIQGSGFSLAKVEWEGLAWRPRVGQRILGSPTLSTPSHISLLLHNLFNASIPDSHISDIYYFDSEFEVPEAIRKRQNFSFPSSSKDGGFEGADKKDGAAVVGEKEEKVAKEEGEEKEKEGEGEEKVEQEKDEEEEEEEDGDAQMKKAESVVDEEEEKYKERGWWRHKVSHEPLGGAEGRIEFTIVGLTITNSMISVTGSLLSHPFAIPAPSKRSVSVVQSTKKRTHTDSDSSESEGSAEEEEMEVVMAPPSVHAKGEEKGKKGRSEKSGKKERKNRAEKSEMKKAEKKAKGKKPKVE